MDEAKNEPRRTVAVLLEDLRRALASLDEIGVPADIGAHLDMAIVRLEEFLEEDPAD